MFSCCLCISLFFCFSLFFSQGRQYSADVAKIYLIHITNVIGGVASQCHHCALESALTGSACVPCPLGHYMVSETGRCMRCPPNTIIKASQAVGEAACIQCGPNMERNKVVMTVFSLPELQKQILQRKCAMSYLLYHLLHMKYKLSTTGCSKYSTIFLPIIFLFSPAQT